MKEGICIGFIGFDSVINNYTYSEQDKRILTIFAEMLVNVYIRRDHIHEIESSKEQIRQINLNLEKEVIEKTQKNTELSRLLTDQEKLAMIGEISAGIAHDLNTPLGSIKVGAESIRYTLENLFKSIIEKSTIEQLHFACNRAVENNIELFIGGIQSRKEAAVIEEYIRLNYPDTTFDVQTLASNLVKARISINETEVINKILQSPNPFDFLNLIYHIQTTRTFIDTILIASDKASQVVKNLRTFVRFDQHSTKGPVNLKDNIATVLNVFNYEINSKVELQFNVDSTITIEGYEIKLYQLWSNLIKNAIEAISGYGKLIIESKETEKSYEISIENDGDVIPDDVLQNMFTKFYTTKSKSNGTGLGLSIVQNVIEDHHAKIHVTSIPNSTRFTITFYK
jgi:signal transduction histidine kinase